MWMPRLSVLAAVLTVASTIPAAGEGTKVPPDFRIVARFGAGESDWKSWTTTIGDGRAVQYVYGGPTKVLPLSAAQIESLAAYIRAQGFGRLVPVYSSAAVDVPTLCLAVTEYGRTKNVRVLLDSLTPPGEPVRRFLRVWSAVLRAVPAPNAAQTPAMYGPDAADAQHVTPLD